GTDRTLKLWQASSGQCLRTFAGHLDAVTAVAMSSDGRFALSGSADRTLQLWILDWELEERQPTDWDEGARRCVEAFVRTRAAYKMERAQVGRGTMRDIVHMPLSQLFKSSSAEERPSHAMTRRGKLRCTEREFHDLMQLLGCAGYGWLRAEGV